MDDLTKEACEASRDGAMRYVVYVPDEGEQLMDAKQYARYAPLVFLQSAWINGVPA